MVTQDAQQTKHREEHTGDMQEQFRIQQNFRFRRVYEDQRKIFSPLPSEEGNVKAA